MYVVFFEERVRSQQFEDEYAWLNKSQIIQDVCQGNALHAEEIIKLAVSKNMSRRALMLLA
jgi:hypothetical protein